MTRSMRWSRIPHLSGGEGNKNEMAREIKRMLPDKYRHTSPAQIRVQIFKMLRKQRETSGGI